jgi:hypothetical protein
MRATEPLLSVPARGARRIPAFQHLIGCATAIVGGIIPGKSLVNSNGAREDFMRVALYGRVSTAEQNAAMQIDEF